MGHAAKVFFAAMPFIWLPIAAWCGFAVYVLGPDWWGPSAAPIVFGAYLSIRAIFHSRRLARERAAAEEEDGHANDNAPPWRERS